MKTKTTPKSKTSGSKKTPEYSMEESKLMKFFEDELKDIYWAEKALTKALPKMAKNATSEELQEALENHLAETEEQIKKLMFRPVDEMRNYQRAYLLYKGCV